MFKKRLILALLVALVVVIVFLSAHNVSAGEGTGGHIGDIISTFVL